MFLLQIFPYTKPKVFFTKSLQNTKSGQSELKSEKSEFSDPNEM